MSLNAEEMVKRMVSQEENTLPDDEKHTLGRCLLLAWPFLWLSIAAISLFFLLVILLVLAFWLDMKRMKKKIVEVEEKSVQATIERTLSELNLAGDKSMPIADKTKPSKEKPKVSTPEKTPTNKDKLQTSFKREMPAELFTDRKVKAPWKAIVGKMKPSKEKLKMPEKTPTSNKGKLQPSFKREMPAELFTDRKVKSPWKEEKDDKKQGNVKHPMDYQPKGQRKPIDPYKIDGPIDPYKVDDYNWGKKPIDPYKVGGSIDPYKVDDYNWGKKPIDPYKVGGSIDPYKVDGPIDPYKVDDYNWGKKPFDPYKIDDHKGRKKYIDPYKIEDYKERVKPIDPYKIYDDEEDSGDEDSSSNGR